MRKIVRLSKREKPKKETNPPDTNTVPKDVPSSLDVVRQRLEAEFAGTSDLVLREIALPSQQTAGILLVCLDGLVNKSLQDQDILRPLLIDARRLAAEGQELSPITAVIKETLISCAPVQEIQNMGECLNAILNGNTLLFVQGSNTALSVDIKDWQTRGVQEPATEAVVRGPREGFIEDIKTNMTLLRRKIKNTNLVFEPMTIGKQTRTVVMICYIKGLPHEEILAMVRQRLSNIKTDAILESGYLEEFIQDTPLSIFPLVGNSEKPDVVASKILEGRVAILCDGTPFVLTVPYLFIESIQASEDHYNKAIYASALRILRFLAILISFNLPALYVALVEFHQDVIPFKLLLTMAATRQGVPYSPFIESLLMLLMFEVLREAGVRLPRPIGQAVSIVGALVMGEAAVQAGLVSTPVVIVIAFTAITGFVIPPLNDSIPFVRLLVLFSAHIIGFLGMFVVSTLFLVHLCSLKSFGVPYMSPMAPFSAMDFKDTILRFPVWTMFTRPRFIANPDQRRRMQPPKLRRRRYS